MLLGAMCIEELEMAVGTRKRELLEARLINEKVMITTMLVIMMIIIIIIVIVIIIIMHFYISISNTQNTSIDYSKS